MPAFIGSQPENTMSDLPEITNELVMARCSDALRRFVGPKKPYGYDDCAAAIDAQRSTVESWVLGNATPQLFKFLKLVALLGPEFANELLRLAHIDGAERVDAAPVTDAALNACAAQLVAILSNAMIRTVTVNHQAKPGCLSAAVSLRSELDGYIAQHSLKPQLVEVK